MPKGQQKAAAAVGQYAPAWRVLWADWRGHHDWIGRRPVKRGGLIQMHRQPPPMTHAQDFLTRQGAEDFVARLRREIPEGEFVVQVVSLRNLTPPLPLDQFLLLGPWPHQSRSK